MLVLYRSFAPVEGGEAVMDIALDALMRRGVVVIRQTFTHPHVFPSSQVRSAPRAVAGVLQPVLCCGGVFGDEGESAHRIASRGAVICYGTR